MVGARIALTILVFNIVRHLLTIDQTRYVLASPLIPESTICDINKQFVFLAIFSAVASIIGLLLYLFKKYLFVMILVVSVLIADRYI